jgi:hypothetical protein
MSQHHEKWMRYMQERRGDYAFRSTTRYRSVACELQAMGLNDSHIIVDVGAGSCQFDHYLRTELGWCGRYLPVDAVLDGTDLETWTPKMPADFFVCIEVLEHLVNPWGLMNAMQDMARIGVVATTPNPATVDVLACDPTHVTPIPATAFWLRGWHVQAESLFGKNGDTLVAHYSVDKAMAAGVGF